MLENREAAMNAAVTHLFSRYPFVAGQSAPVAPPERNSCDAVQHATLARAAGVSVHGNRRDRRMPGLRQAWRQHRDPSNSASFREEACAFFRVTLLAR